MIKFRNSYNLKAPYLEYPTACCKFDSCGSHLTIAGPVMVLYKKSFLSNIHTFEEVPTTDTALSYVNKVKLSASMS